MLNAIRFIRDTVGPAAHDEIVAALPAVHATTFRGLIREASWEPLDDFVAYLETAKRLLAPTDSGFYRRLGRFSGELERQASAFKVMVEDPSTAMRMGPTVWRSFFDVGRLEVEILAPREGTARVFDFPGCRALCDRRCGAWEGLLSTAALSVEVDESLCRADGHSFCEHHVVWRPVEHA